MDNDYYLHNFHVQAGAKEDRRRQGYDSDSDSDGSGKADERAAKGKKKVRSKTESARSEATKRCEYCAFSDRGMLLYAANIPTFLTSRVANAKRTPNVAAANLLVFLASPLLRLASPRSQKQRGLIGRGVHKITKHARRSLSPRRDGSTSPTPHQVSPQALEARRREEMKRRVHVRCRRQDAELSEWWKSALRQHLQGR